MVTQLIGGKAEPLTWVSQLLIKQFCLLFTIFPVGHRKEIGKVRRLRENFMDKSKGAPI